MEKVKKYWKKFVSTVITIILLIAGIFVGGPILFPPTPRTGDTPTWATITSLAEDGSLRCNDVAYATAWSAAAALSNYNTSSYSTVGHQLTGGQYYIGRGFIPFNTSTIIYATNTIVTAILSIALYATSAFNNTLNVYLPEPAYLIPSVPLELTDFNQANFDTSTYLGTLNCTTGAATTATYYNITLTPLIGLVNLTQSYVKLILRTDREKSQDAPSGGSANQTSVYYNESTTYVPKLYLEYSVDPTASGTPNQLRDPFQRKTFYTTTGQRSWVAFLNASGNPPVAASDAWFVLTSTTDNTNFVDPVAIGNSGDGVGEGASLYYDTTNNYVHFVYKKAATNDLAYRRGIPDGTDGSIDMTAESLIVDGNTTMDFIMPSIIADTNNYSYVCAQQRSTTYPVWLFKNELNDGSWTTEWNYNFTLTAASTKAGRGVPLLLLDNKIGVLFNKNTDTVYYSQWTSDSSTPEIENEVASENTCYHGDFMSGVTIRDNVHLNYLHTNVTSAYIFHRMRDSATNSWNTEVLIIDLGYGVLDAGTVMNWDKSDDSLRVFWANSGNDHLYYRQRFNNGTLAATVDFYTSSEPLLNNRTIHVNYDVSGCENLSIAFQTGEVSPYHVHMLNILINGTDLAVGWNENNAITLDVDHTLGEMGDSLDYDSLSWSVITVDYLNGTQWSLIYDTTYNSDKLITAESKLWIYCLEAGLWNHIYS